MDIMNNNILNQLSKEEIIDSIHNSSLNILFFDPDEFKIIYANNEVMKFYGYSEEEILNKDISLLFIDSEIESFKKNIISNKNSNQKIFITKHKLASGDIVDIQGSSRSIKINDKTYYIIAITDITKRKKLEKIIENKNSALINLNKNLNDIIREESLLNKKKEKLFVKQAKLSVVGEIINSLSTQIKTPINEISNQLHILESINKNYKIDPKTFDNIVESIMSNLLNIDSYIGSFKNFFQYSNCKENFDIYLIICDIETLISGLLSNKNVQFVIDCSCANEVLASCGAKLISLCPHKFLSINGMKEEFRQVILNVILNSLDAIDLIIDENQIDIDTYRKISLQIVYTNDNIKITIDDNGPGINNKYFDKIFNPYFSTKEDGLGLGLYTSKISIEQNFSGTINLANLEDNKGCRVEIVINNKS